MSESVLTKKQVRKYGPVPCPEYGKGAQLTANVRFDDECGNGHNTFAITGSVRVNGQLEAGGCLHGKIAKYIPELAPFIKWHLCSTDGPMHYIGNTVYHAEERDHNGLLKGEFKQFIDKKTGWPEWIIDIPADYRGFSGRFHQYACAQQPGPVTFHYTPYGRMGEGKKRELNLARSSAIWPDATDEDLIAPGLEERLKARLPQLMKEFREAVESLGFTW